ncbi:hypothetical protein EVAR_4642_1 [Eumeta japonica]|uniref:Uncharacterized protein n=1 Tax=Eumeta variegata TaxID=151549 RepID=A0A4C1SZ25_EUMVA|nr:hypothetical protein EVAR_4642_1 [Eumeta japonica]
MYKACAQATPRPAPSIERSSNVTRDTIEGELKSNGISAISFRYMKAASPTFHQNPPARRAVPVGFTRTPARRDEEKIEGGALRGAVQKSDRYPILFQEAGNTSVTPPVLRVSVGGSDH